MQAEAHDRIQSLEALVRELRHTVESTSESSQEKSALLSEEITTLKGKVSNCMDGMCLKKEINKYNMSLFVCLHVVYIGGGDGCGTATERSQSARKERHD